MREFVAYYSRWRLALLFLLCVGLVALGMALVGMFGELPKFSESQSRSRFPPEFVAFISWAGILFFGPGTAIIGKKFFDHKPQLRVSSDGVVWSQWSDQIIPWAEVTDISSWHYMGQAFIVLHLKHPDRFPGRGLGAKLAKTNRRLTGGDINISMIGTDSTFIQAMLAIVHFWSDASRI